MQAGQAASAGVFSAVLAKTGFTGAQNIFNGRYGFFELYKPNGHDSSVVLRDLGTAIRGEALSYKPYPCGRRLHAAIDAALAARATAARKPRSASRLNEPTGARSPSRPPIRSGRHASRSRVPSSRQSSATVREMRCRSYRTPG